jgi:hypothetical protein
MVPGRKRQRSAMPPELESPIWNRKIDEIAAKVI